MAIVTLTTKQRLNLELVAGSQSGTLSETRIPGNIFNKVLTSKSFRKQFVIVLSNGGECWDDEKLEVQPSVEIDFEVEELEKLVELLEKGKFLTTDRAWITPLLEQVRSMLAPTSKTGPAPAKAKK